MSQINVNVDGNIKKEATAILDKLGMNMTQAVNMMLRQVIYTQRLPFDVCLPSDPNKETIESFHEMKGSGGENLKQPPGKYLIPNG